MSARRTSGIPRVEKLGRPGDVLGVHPNSSDESAAARRLVQREARDNRDAAELLDALGLNEGVVDDV
ncbi:hypothetical protein [Streptomyces sp. NPDC053079]|uniref:hypothetical protein n=1 Tax=Streptomyces sp. NPDC053079 TaxID=3365697 RepID=UPI0037D2DBD4